MTGRHRTWLAIVAIVAAILIFMHRLAFTNLILARGDTLLYFYPYWEAAAAALREAKIPLWNPHLFMGAPFIANSQIGFFYPLNWPGWLLLPVPYAATASIIAHATIAGIGVYCLARRQLAVSRSAALLGASLFVFGGYYASQAEHLNQFQGLAWLPWILFLLTAGPGQRKIQALRRTLALAAVLAMQFLAGHTQTVFITVIAACLWPIGMLPDSPSNDRRSALGRLPISSWIAVVVAGILALLIVAVQLLPTLELIQLSGRSGGLPFNEVVSFSLPLLMLPRALLPGYGESLFTEYQAFLPVTALLLGWLGASAWRREPTVRAPLLLAVVGLAFALGRFNPIYILLARMPGFDLFRAPARWLVLYTLGMSLLASFGWDRVGRAPLRQRWVRVGALSIIFLMSFAAPAVLLARLLPPVAEAPITLPSRWTVLGWVVELTLALVVLSGRLAPRYRSPILALVMIAVLFLASRTLPYNQPTAPAAYFELRAPVTRLQARAMCSDVDEPCNDASSSGRFLSLSDIFFDLGDTGEIHAVYGDQLSDQQLYDYIIATKHKEVISPNLPLSFDLHSVDGFDGGILPLRDYITLTQLILPADASASDGRLREYLNTVPEPQWLDLFGARYLITDKIAGTVWRDEVLFDVQLPVTVAPGAEVEIAAIPAYEATGLWVLGEDPGRLRVVTQSGARWELEPMVTDNELVRFEFPLPAIPSRLTFTAASTPWRVEGAALVDVRDSTFATLVPGNYQLVYSGDVKIYENLDVLPKAFLVSEWGWQPDGQSAVDAMAAQGFNPAEVAVVVGENGSAGQDSASAGQAVVSDYTTEQIIIRTTSNQDTLLVVTDAFYPGWEATIDGEPAAIYKTDGFFRGVFLSAGDHVVEMRYVPESFARGGIVSLLTILAFGAFVALAILGGSRRRSSHSSTKS